MSLIKLDAKEMQLDGKTFKIYKMSAIDGRKLIFQYPISVLPKVGDYVLNEKLMRVLLSYVSVVTESGAEIPLSSDILIDNHVGGALNLLKLEKEVAFHTLGFSSSDEAWDFLKPIIAKGLALITSTLTPSSAPSSPLEKPLSLN